MSESKIVFRRVLVASEEAAPREADVLIEDGVIVGVEERGIAETSGARIIEGYGRKILMPGCFDPHVHLREPGKVAAETVKTGTEAAINGGVTGVVAMPNTTPAIDTGPMVQNVRDIAAKTARIPVYVSGAITKGRKGEELAAMAAMKAAGAVMITDDGDPVANPQVLRRAMRYAAVSTSCWLPTARLRSFPARARCMRACTATSWAFRERRRSARKSASPATAGSRNTPGRGSTSST